MGRNLNVSKHSVKSTSGKDVKQTKQLTGEASKDSLTGKNVVQEYSTSGRGFSGPFGGKPVRK